MTHVIKNNEWLIIGAGAVGLLWAYKLHKAGLTVHLLDKSSTQNDPIEYQCGIERNLFTVKRFTIKTLNITYSNILITTKAFDVLAAVISTKRFFAPEANIICLTNGMGFHTSIQKQLLSSQRLICGITSEGAFKHQANVVEKTGDGQIQFGYFSTPTKTVSFTVALFPEVLAPFYSDNIVRSMLTKLVINAIINPLTSLYGVRNGELLSNRFTHIIERAAEEIIQLITHHEFHYQKHVGNDLCRTNDLVEQVYHVAKKTTKNSSSMLVDLQQKRETEVDYISGFLLEQARHCGITMPVQTSFLNRIKSR